MRAHATNNDYKSFKAGLHPNHSDEHAKKLYKATRQGLNLQNEETGMKDFRTFLFEDDKPNKTGDDAKGHKRPTEDGAGLTAKGVAADVSHFVLEVEDGQVNEARQLDEDGIAEENLHKNLGMD